MTVTLEAGAVLFDLDGTLVDSTTLITRSWTAWAVEQGLTREDFRQVPLHGRPARDIVRDLVPAERVDGALASIIAIELATPGGVVPLPGAVELLRSLPRHRWGIVTSGSDGIARPRLRVLDLEAPALVTADDVRHGKPDPEPFLLCAARLGVAPEQCVVVEDAPAGLAAARAAGMRAIAVSTTHERSELVADVIVDRLTSVRAVTDASGVVLLIEA
ncbi:MAG: HAD-IA family hydrolase [Candidatus Dormiibacterota bacterium]